MHSTCVSPHDIDAAAASVHVAATVVDVAVADGGRDEDELRFAVGRESLFFLVLYFDSRTLKILWYFISFNNYKYNCYVNVKVN